MSDTPERIWAKAFKHAPNSTLGVWTTNNTTDGPAGYIRDDLYDALQARAEAAEAALARHEKTIAGLVATEELSRRNARDTFDAMCAMRNSINEHTPMPSLESDLLQGPESGVFCATVAETVVSALKAERAKVARLVEAGTRAADLMERYGLSGGLASDIRAAIDAAKGE